MAEPDLDLVLLLQACSAAVGDDALSRVRAAVGDDVTYRDGYLFQHLLVGPQTGTSLAGLLEVTQQAASKQLADLERRGLVDRERHPDDARAWQFRLSERGMAAVEAGREARSEIEAEVATALGQTKGNSLRRLLASLSDHTGAVDRLMSRTLTPEADR